MLVQLSVEHLVLVDQATLELGRGFNVLTGEAGAGKSMLVDALGLVLGARARPDLVRQGRREAEVAALFELAPSSPLLARLRAADVPCDGQLVVRRVVQAGGRSRAYLNGRLSTAGQLAELAPLLCDVASQHEQVTLTDAATHLDFLDAFGDLGGLRHRLGIESERLLACVRERQSVLDAERSRRERSETLRQTLAEIDALDPRIGEEHELERDRERLRHASQLEQRTRSAAAMLEDSESAACDVLARALAELSPAAVFDSSLEPLVRAISDARELAVDAARSLARYAEAVDADPTRLAEVEDRAFRIKRALRTFGPTTADLLVARDRMRRELAALDELDDRLAALEEQHAAQLGIVTVAARELARRRRDVADKLARAVTAELGRLGMTGAALSVDIAPVPVSSDTAIVIDAARLTTTGLDRVEFLMSANRGEPPRPLRRVASGGELSRALLAIKRVLTEVGSAGLYVFDEVDTGVGGAVAEVIGQKLRAISRRNQTLVITHLPQIAAYADKHYVVSKRIEGERTVSEVRALSEAERTEEIARMLGGLRVTDRTRAAAAEMIRTAASP